MTFDKYMHLPRSVLNFKGLFEFAIKFTTEFEKSRVIPFFDVLIKRHIHTFSTSIYKKKTFTGPYT